MKIIFGTIFLFINLFEQIECANILSVAVFPGKSHFMMTKSLIKGLLTRGHKVTLVTPFSMDEKLNNYTEVLIPQYDFWTDIINNFNVKSIFDLSEVTTSDFFHMIHLLGVKSTEFALQQPKVQEIINDTDVNKYDLLITEHFYQDAFLALSYKYNIPVITFSTLGFENYNSQQMGFLSPWSFVPHGFLPYDDKMNLYERLMNTIYSFYEDYLREYDYFPKQDKLVQRYFSHLPVKIPSVSKMEKNISLILLNSHVPLVTPRPFIHGIIQVGGIHIQKPKPLPKNIQNFLDSAKDGVIYFSLGTIVRSSDISSEKLNAFLNVFKNLKQKVLWKYEDENIQKLPENVMIQKWMPQSDILAHPNIKVFITHGGLFGTQEGVYYGIPLLGIPVYCDQILNVHKASKVGYAIGLDFSNITETSLKWSLNELIYNPSYRNNAKRISQIFRDRPMSAMDTAMYWIDYVIRYKGTPQLRSAGLDLPWYSFYLIDVIGILLLAIILILFILYKIFKKLKNDNTNNNKRSRDNRTIKKNN